MLQPHSLKVQGPDKHCAFSYESTSTFSQLAVPAPITSGQELVRKLMVAFQVINLTWARTASGNQVSQIFGNSRYVTFPGASLCTAPQPPPAQGHFLVPISSSKGYSPQRTNALHLACFHVGPTDNQIDSSLGLFLFTHIVGLSKISFSLSLERSCQSQPAPALA